MLFRQINSFFCAPYDWKYVSLSEVCFENAHGYWQTIHWIFGTSELSFEKSKRFSEGANYRSKIHGELSRDANYCLKNRANQNNRCHENVGKFRQKKRFRRNFFEKPRKARNFVKICFHYFCTILYIHLQNCLLLRSRPYILLFLGNLNFKRQHLSHDKTGSCSSSNVHDFQMR